MKDDDLELNDAFSCCSSPHHFKNIMEKHRLSLSTRRISTKEFAPIFVIQLLKVQLNLTSREDQRSPIVGRRDADDSYTLTQGRAGDAAEDQDYLQSPYLLPGEESKERIQTLFIFCMLLKSEYSIQWSEDKMRNLFIKRIEQPCLELIWMISLSKYKLFEYTSYLLRLGRGPAQPVIDFCMTQFLDFCFSSSLFKDAVKRKCTMMLQDFLPQILIAFHFNPEGSAPLLNLKRIADGILAGITRRLLSNDDNVCSVMSRSLLLASIQELAVPNFVLQGYFTCQLNEVLRQESNLKPRDVLRQQEKFAGAVDIQDPAKWETISVFISEPHTSKREILEIISKRLGDPEVNWEVVLLIITIWSKSDEGNGNLSSVFNMVKETIRRLINSGLTNEKESDILAAFILARHCCLVSPQYFSRYEKWYVGVLGSEATSLAKTPETFTFLATILSSWIPDEPVCFLQVHATYWPYTPAGMRTVWGDYINLSKFRISEYNDIELAMEYEPNPNNPIQYHIEMVLKSFDSVKKIPEAISEMLMFRKQYYYEQFLPSLLRKPHGVPLSDGRLRLIEALNAAGKIPPNLYATYKTS